MNILQMIQMARAAGNPQQLQAFITAQIQKDPVWAKAHEMTRGKSQEEILEVAKNYALSSGRTKDFETYRQKLGV